MQRRQVRKQRSTENEDEAQSLDFDANEKLTVLNIFEAFELFAVISLRRFEIDWWLVPKIWILLYQLKTGI